MTRLAVIGAGSFGKNHVRVVSENPRAELKYVVDADLDAPANVPATAVRRPLPIFAKSSGMSTRPSSRSRPSPTPRSPVRCSKPVSTC